MADSASPGTLDSATEHELHYEAVEPLAIVALLLGLVSPAALAAPVLWLLPVLGLVAGTAALLRIRRAPGRPGRALALVGLALASFFLAAAIAATASTTWLLARQARPRADQFVEYLRQGSPEKALLLHMAPDYRHPDDEGLWTYYRRNEEARANLRKFVANPAIRMILALGERAEIRYFRIAGAGSDDDMGQVELWYTVTFTGDDGRKKTYLLSLLMERRATKDPELSPWRLRDFVGGVDPGR
jgi:hypothetical protein